MSLSTLEVRLSKGLTLKDALNKPMRSLCVTKKQLEECEGLTFNQTCKLLKITSRKLNNLCKEYDIYFHKKRYKKDELKTLLWIAVNSNQYTVKGIAKVIKQQVNLDLSIKQIDYLFVYFGINLTMFKKNPEYIKTLVYSWLIK